MPVELDQHGFWLINGSQRIPLTPTEMQVASYLYHQRGRIVSPRELMATIWNERDPIDTTVVRMAISSIRYKAGDHVIVTRHRLGYMWGEDDESAQ